VTEVASRLKCHPHTVRRWIWSGRLNAVKVGDLIRVPEEEIDRLLEPVEVTAPRQKSDKQKGVASLRATMSTLRKKLEIEDVDLLERLIAEGKQPADWSTPIA
jgi:excisionase family DNA binding protein